MDRYFGWFRLHMSLAVKLAGPVLVTTVLLASAMGGMVSNAVQSQIQDAYDQEAGTVAAGVVAIYMQNPNDTAELDDYLARLVTSRPDLLSVRIVGLDANTTVIASSNPSEVGLGDLADANERAAVWGGTVLTDHDEPSLVTVYPLAANDVRFGAVMITSSRAGEISAVQSITFSIGLAALISVVVESGFVLSVLYLGIIRRTRRMQKAVEAVDRGDTKVRLFEGTEPRGRDEIFNLARSVDHMIATLDERQRGDALIRRLGRSALEGTPTAQLITDGVAATRQAMGLQDCIFVSLSENGSVLSWLDGLTDEHRPAALPVWVFALSHVAVEARKAVLTDRLGQHSRFAEEGGVPALAQAAIVPLPRTSKAGQAIVAIAAMGETIPDRGLAVLDAVAATLSESLHMQAAENARAESAVKSKVMSAVSHEMRNPLNSILGFTALVLGAPGDRLTEKQRRQLGYVQTSANNMLTLVNNYLDLAKLRSGSVTLQYETMKVASIVGEVEAVMQPVADARQVAVRTSVDPELVARVDPVRLRQILVNLVSNAVKFTPPGGHVYLRGRVVGQHLRLTVSDTGVGIAKDQQRLLFAEFAKIDAGAMAAAKGTGLGLALTKAFAVAMGGTIKVYSRRGRGSTFVVDLPLSGAPARQAGAAA